MEWLQQKPTKKTINVVSSKYHFQFDNKFYKQLDGVAMGSPIGSLMADVIMNCVIDKALEITPQLHRPSFFCRYVDDCFATFTEPTSIDIFFNNLNSIHKQIQFTKEIESNNSLAFLDVLIEKSDCGINSSTYHKPTHTGPLLKYSSFSPIRYKRNLINNLLQRSFTICNSYLKIDSEFQSIKITLMRNEYPSRLIDRCIRKFLNKKFSQHPETQTQTCNHFSFKLPYLGNISHNIEKELQQFIKKQLPDSKLRFIHTTTKLKHYFHTKDPKVTSEEAT